MFVRKRLRALSAATLAAIIAVTLAGLVGSGVNADTRSEKEKADQAVSELKQQIAESSAKLAAAEKAFAAAEAQLKDARATLSRIQNEVAAARAREADLARKLDAAKAAEVEAEAALAALNKEVEAGEDKLGVMVRQAYQAGPAPELALALNADSFQEYATQQVYLEQLSTTQNALVEEVQARRAAAASQEAALTKRRAEAAELQAAAVAQVKERTAAEEKARAAAAEVEQLADAREAAVQAAERELEEDERQHAAMRAESERLADLIAAEVARTSGSNGSSGGSSDQPASSSSSLIKPVNAPVTSPFGYRTHPISGARKLHTGTDFGAPSGTAVRAAASGKVIQSEYNSGGYGNRIVVSHGYIGGEHLTTTYNHLSSRGVSAGEQVGQGEVIGRVGSTGYSTGPHLHFEVLENGEFVNPMNWL